MDFFCGTLVKFLYQITRRHIPERKAPQLRRRDAK